MNKSTLDQILQQAQQGHQQEQADFDTTDLQQNIMAHLALEPEATQESPAAAVLEPILARWENALWQFFSHPWWAGATALVPLALGFSLGSLDGLQSFEQLGDGWNTTQTLLTAEPTWAALLEDSHEQ